MSQVLSGVRVVELASWTYVPSAGAALADWGADVIKVEDVKAGDPGRALVIGGFTRQNARADVDFILAGRTHATLRWQPTDLPSNLELVGEVKGEGQQAASDVKGSAQDAKSNVQQH